MSSKDILLSAVMKPHHTPSHYSHLCCSCLCQEQRLRDLDKLILGILGSNMNIESSKEDFRK